MIYSYDRAKETEKMISSVRPEFDDLDFWAEQIRKRLSTDDLDQHCLYLSSRLEELMEETTSGHLSMGGVEHSLELAKVAEITNHLEAVEATLEGR
ncbi:hypothetical protein IDM48_11340 (plasmid) [Rothia amarae]|uniref:Uncharacterized protein n=1 Tax=Rothia amarae TaxID=169480 RepID=A0A7S6WX08_9MICC|nr:hypothetical protein [Rothia amarae]QOW64934.1 hypothetical protein IDM48_11340 [Rothia amarae]